MDNLKYIKAVTFGFMTPRGKLADEKAKASMKKMVEETAADTVILCLVALQKTAHTEKMSYIGKHMPTDNEVKEIIYYAQSLGLRVILKPMVNCEDGTWRAHINFFDKEVPCEPKWSKWFKYYTEFQLHYAEIAQECQCEMLIIGCEMVQAQRKELEWRKLISEIRKVYKGLISYNTDKYQEEEVKWWDAVDVISSSGYYPIDKWEQELDRIEKVIKVYNKPFFFAEAGCMSSEGSSYIPNNWELAGKLNLEEQRLYYEVMFRHCKKRAWIKGFGIWSWEAQLYEKEAGENQPYYDVYGKPASKEIKAFYSQVAGKPNGIL